MAIKKLKPNTSGTRHMSVLVREDIDKVRPLKSLTAPLKSAYGRDMYGHRTAVNRQKGHKRLYRIIDFKRNKLEVPGTVVSIEYDPNRTANIALVSYIDGEKRYIIAPNQLKKGEKISSSASAEIKPGNSLKLKDIPIGTLIYNIEMQPNKGGQLVRSAGTSARLISKEGKYCYIELPSKELRLILSECRATIGTVSNADHELEVIGKAGRNRHKGRRPHVRGAAMNPVDHPHGGGEGKAPRGRHPVSAWGKPALGKKTRDKKKASTKFIIRRKNDHK